MSHKLIRFAFILGRHSRQQFAKLYQPTGYHTFANKSRTTLDRLKTRSAFRVLLANSSNFSIRTPEPILPKTLSQYLEQLRADVAKLRRVNLATLSSALDQARFSSAGKCSQEDALFLLECCSMMPEKPRPEKLALIELAWALVVRDQEPTSEQLVKLLREYRTNGKKLDYTEFLQKHGKTVDMSVFESLLYLAGENGSAEGMVEILSAIKAKDLPLTENVFNALILGHSRCRNIDNCEMVLDTMATANMEPSPRTHKEMIRAYIENTAPEKAEALLQAKGATLSVVQVLSVIRTAIRRDDQSRVVQMSFKLLPEEVLCNRHIIPEIRNACVELVRANEHRKAFRIIEHLNVPKFGDHEDSDGYATFFLSELIRTGTPHEEVIEMARKMVESGRNSRALHVCCEVALRHDSDDALSYLQELAKTENLRPHYFWPLFLREYRLNGESGILNVIKQMDELKVSLDYETIANYILAKIPLILEDVVSGIKILEDRGARMTDMMAPLVAYLINHRRLKDAEVLVKTYQTKIKGSAIMHQSISFVRDVRGNYQTEFAPLVKLIKAISAKDPAESDLTGQLLMELVSNSNKRMSFEALVALLQQLKAQSVKISKISGDVIMQYLLKSPDETIRVDAKALLEKISDGSLNGIASDNFDEHIRHPRDMTLEELECHLVELQTKGLNTRGVLRRLLQMNVRTGKLDRALEVHRQCQEKGVAFSPGMVASVLELKTRTKDVSGAFAAIEQMRSLFPNFTIDEHKIIDLAALLAEQNRLDDAKKLLKSRSVTHPIRGGAHVQKNVWQLLTNVATLSSDPKDPPLVREMFQFLIELGYCEAQNNLLGPIIREHLHKGQLTDAVSEFMNIVHTHKKTPLQFEILCHLITATNATDSAQINQSEAQSLLGKVVEESSKIHGSNNVSVALVLAFAKCGTERQLRKILMDPAAKLNMESVLTQCEYLCGIGNVEPLIRLAKCSRGLQSGASEHDFYNMALSQYVRQNDYMAALDLFEQIVADDEFKVTAEFTRTLVGLLQRNNLEIPSSVKVYSRS